MMSRKEQALMAREVGECLESAVDLYRELQEFERQHPELGRVKFPCKVKDVERWVAEVSSDPGLRAA